MTRARETADIIHKVLPDIPREETDILREGAPIPPEPPLGTLWLLSLLNLSDMCSCNQIPLISDLSILLAVYLKEIYKS
jgi:hypothetical protein